MLPRLPMDDLSSVGASRSVLTSLHPWGKSGQGEGCNRDYRTGIGMARGLVIADANHRQERLIMPKLDTEILPLLPLTTGVVLPGMVVTLTIESEEARQAL